MKIILFLLYAILINDLLAVELQRRKIDGYQSYLDNQIALSLYTFTVADFENVVNDREGELLKSISDARMGSAEVYFALYIEWTYSGIDFKKTRANHSKAVMIRKIFKVISWDKFTAYINKVGKEQLTLYFINYNVKNFEEDLNKFSQFLNEK